MIQKVDLIVKGGQLLTFDEQNSATPAGLSASRTAGSSPS